MHKSFKKILDGYKQFRTNYNSLRNLQDKISSDQKPEIMIVSCCDSRVDPAIIFECDPGDLFIVRNIANIVPPYEKDSLHHGTSAALEFGVNFLKVKHLIVLGHSNCGGIKASISNNFESNDFISNWLSILDFKTCCENDQEKGLEHWVKKSLKQSYFNCLSFPWIKEKTNANTLAVHTWYFDLDTGTITVYDKNSDDYVPLHNVNIGIA